MNNPDHISESLEKFVVVKIINLMRIRDGKNSDPGWKNSDPGSENWDPGWKKFGSGIRDKRRGSATLVPYRQMG
jgi:hypothetical protein